MAVKVVRLDNDDAERLSCVSFIDVNIVKRKLEEEAVAFAAFDEGEVCGAIVLEPLGVSNMLTYLYVIKQKRRQGIGKSLLDAVRIYDPKIYLEEGETLSDDIDSFLTDCGFVQSREIDLYSFEKTEETLAYCDGFMRMHGNAVMQMMERRGFEAVKMGMARPGLIDKLGDEIGEGFDEEMNPFNIINLDEDWSYIVSKDDEPAAFVACTTYESKLAIEMLCAREDHMGAGPAMMALMTLLERIVADDGITEVTTAVTKENDDIVKLLDDKFYELISDKKKVRIFTRAD